MLTWHIITGEYPPIIGGVSDYCQVVAEGLAGAGDEVHVWCPPLPEPTVSNGVEVHPKLGRFSSHDLRAAGRLLDRFAPPRRLLVQWVPHGFGYRSMNVGFCFWIHHRARRGDRVEIMVHEPYLAFGEGALTWTAAAAVHRLMTVILARAARRIWISVPEWERRWRPYALGREVPFEWLPIPSTLPAPAPLEVYGTADRSGVSGTTVVGHLGSYGADETRMLAASLPQILERAPSAVGILLGQKSEECRDRLVAAHPQLATRLCATGSLASHDLARYVRACDVLVQPYPDGITSRRTSAMAGLALGVPVVTTIGRLTEPLWERARCVSLVPAGDSQALAAETIKLLSEEGARCDMAALGRRIYAEIFDVRHTIAALRRADPASCASPS
jgi:glycosyltransferase involved in cell wall biosynthesis